ncbi:MAG: hypothetical protein NVSMB42_18780 [Herpetosiphon sp.]
MGISLAPSSLRFLRVPSIHAGMVVPFLRTDEMHYSKGEIT